MTAKDKQDEPMYVHDLSKEEKDLLIAYRLLNTEQQQILSELVKQYENTDEEK